MDFKEVECEGVGSIWEPLAGCSEHSNELSVSTGGGDYLEQLRV
jgi:hypothetical protein